MRNVLIILAQPSRAGRVGARETARMKPWKLAGANPLG